MVKLSKSYPNLATGQYSNPALTIPSADALADDYWYAFAQTDVGDSFMLLEALLTPQAVTKRISETRELRVGRWDVRTSRLLNVPRGLKFFPVMRYAKGQVLGHIRVEVEGARTHTLTFEQSKGAIIDAIHTLWPKVVGGNADGLLKEVLRACVSDEPPTEGAYQGILARLEGAIKAAGKESASEPLLSLLVQYALALDFVFAHLPPVADKGVKPPRKEHVRRLDVEFQDLRPRTLISAKSRFRALLGLGDRDFSLPLSLVSEAKSYHLTVRGPVGMYLYRLRPFAVGADTSALSTAAVAADQPRQPTVTLSERVGDEVGHLYARNFDGLAATDEEGSTGSAGMLVARAEFRELPPGIIGPVTLVSCWITLLVWVVGWNFHTIFASPQGSGSWPAVVFGVPAVVTGLILSRLTKEIVRTMSLPVFMCAIWLTFNTALIIVLVALISINPSATFDFTTGFAIGPTFETTQFPWALAMLSCLFLSIVSISLSTF